MVVNATELKNRVKLLVKDQRTHLTEEDYDAALRTALSRYADDAPRLSSEDFTGDGQVYQFSPTNTDYDADFSQVLEVEYPADSRPREYLRAQDWTLYQPTGAIELLNHTPGDGEVVRITYNAKRTLEGLDGATETTIPGQHEVAVEHLAAANLLLRLADKFLHDQESSLYQADGVQRDTKADQARRLAAYHEKIYADAVGIEAGVGGFSTRVNWQQTLTTGHEPLTHPSWRR